MIPPAWQFALLAVERGWAVFPLRPKDKVPLPNFRWTEESSADPRQVFRWTAAMPDANVGIDLAKSNLLVLDVDVKIKNGDGWDLTMQGYHDLAVLFADHQWWPEQSQAASITATGGWHLFFAQALGTPLRGRTQKAGPLGHHIDVKSAGGYVLAPGSYVPSKVHAFDGDDHYRVQQGVRWDDLPAVPLWLSLLINPPPPPPPSPARQLSALRASLQAPEGRWERRIADLAATHVNRNEALNATAYGLRTLLLVAGGPAVGDLVRALRGACESNGLLADDGESTCIGTVASGLGLAPGTVRSLW